MLWFDVGNGRYTTGSIDNFTLKLLWFDVGNGRYTTVQGKEQHPIMLWFDVGNGRYTTDVAAMGNAAGCGLM